MKSVVDDEEQELQKHMVDQVIRDLEAMSDVACQQVYEWLYEKRGRRIYR